MSTPYDGTAKTLLHKLKFERASAAAQDIAAAMAARMQLSGPAVVSYIPTAPSRVRMRGYDQAQRIARELARQLGLPYAPLLTRVTSARQVGQNREVRRKQMQQAFRPTHAARQFKDAHVLLVDDVITTGATCEAAAAALREAGISRVSVSVFAAA
ncbi:MAG TPA: phosphoribosyltransferase family protein [Candidatus Saccharimonadales bacterium]|nr:phosphoribosyltransferase family protein [Candidatus Saccharimonadales bacterium]